MEKFDLIPERPEYYAYYITDFKESSLDILLSSSLYTGENIYSSIEIKLSILVIDPTAGLLTAVPFFEKLIRSADMTEKDCKNIKILHPFIKTEMIQICLTVFKSEKEIFKSIYQTCEEKGK